MMSTSDMIWMAAAGVIAILMIFVVTARRKQHREFVVRRVEEEVCEHLRPAMDLLLSQGANIINAGQRRDDMPFEIHTDAPFDPQTVYQQAKLAEPAHVSERGVLYCKDDWVEIHPSGAGMKKR